MSIRPTTPSPATQDYLRALYLLARRDPAGARVTTSALASRLRVRPASATAMLQKMAAAQPGLVDYHKSHGARLTADGERAALQVVRCHRLLELFLQEKLGYSWDEVDEEADRLEHVVGAELVERLAAALGHPTRDPHGHAIPDASLRIDPPRAVPLRHLRAGQAAVVQQVRDEDSELLREASALGLVPGAHVRLESSEPPRLRVQGEERTRLPSGLMDAVLVVVLPVND